MLCMCWTRSVYIFVLHQQYIYIICHTMYAHYIHYPYICIHAHTSLYIQRINIHYSTCACVIYTMYIYIHIYICSIYAYFNMLEDTWSTGGGCCLKYPTEVRPDGRGAFMKLPERLPGGPIWRANHPGNS